MKILEQFIESKTGRMETCEDAIFVNEHFAVIIDGVTNKTEKTWDNLAPGQIAKNRILEEIPHIKPDVDAKEFFLNCNAAILNWYNKKKITIEMQHHIDQRCTASMVVYSNFRRELWMVGTGQAHFNGQTINKTKIIDDLMAQTRALFIESEIKKGKIEKELIINDYGRDFIKPLLLRQVMFQNSELPSEFNYYEIDGFYKETIHIDKISIPAKTPFLVLASDGYPEISATLAESENLLSSVIKNDPLCFKRYKSTHGLKQGYLSFDDRSYIKIAINE